MPFESENSMLGKKGPNLDGGVAKYDLEFLTKDWAKSPKSPMLCFIVSALNSPHPEKPACKCCGRRQTLCRRCPHAFTASPASALLRSRPVGQHLPWWGGAVSTVAKSSCVCRMEWVSMLAPTPPVPCQTLGD